MHIQTQVKIEPSRWLSEKVLVIQTSLVSWVWAPEPPHTSQEWWHMLTIQALGKQWQEDSWGSLANQSSQSVSTKPMKDSVSRKQGELYLKNTQDWPLWPPHAHESHTHARTHAEQRIGRWGLSGGRRSLGRVFREHILYWPLLSLLCFLSTKRWEASNTCLTTMITCLPEALNQQSQRLWTAASKLDQN